ncbi:multiple inositol polyphosphate phosphatase 1-like [Lutzomyia longipalpis]|uniref:Multiple inositol polyphosphate phosphatase 1 n=1 Tax=Lutzomyia longipalpis TaxID=7200 RepID=A0A7G3AG44_LUTLO|nr:multiple inositol polyphosphate phosphatase 1-like [Lutzomyia longipalpis]XP_055690990.1 multiple inositol polyphosphate phosphatase 1-like [Lutzomyia longipalpis]
MNFVTLCGVFILMLSIEGSLGFVTQCCEEYCYGTDSDREQARHYATKSAYQIIKSGDSSRYYSIPNCEPTKFWMLSRHGTRLPSAKDMQKLRGLIDLRDQIIDNYEKRRSKPDTGALCDADYHGIKNWRWDSNLTGNFDNFLTSQGWEDLVLLAKHYQRILPNVLPNIYTSDKYLFRHTGIQRTEESFRAFVEGLFGVNAYQHVTLPPDNNNTLLRPYDYCPAWETQSDVIDEPSSEMSKFIASEIYQDMLNQVSQRLGFKFQLTDDQVEQIWDMCRYEQAWYLQKLSPWCAAFTKTHVEILEYKEDLKYYFKNGYGSPLNSKVACALVADMMKNLESDAQPQAVAYFAHDSAIQLLMTALGANKDRDSLRADNFLQNNRRTWRTSDIAPFGANLVAIKYNCPESNEPKKVMFFLNEKPVSLDWCRVGLCDWKDVRQMYNFYTTTDCSRTFCGGSTGNAIKVSLLALIVLPVITGILRILN